MNEALWYIAVGVWFVIVTYLAIRVGSFAYFRTKLEYWRSVIREGKHHNGKGQ